MNKLTNGDFQEFSVTRIILAEVMMAEIMLEELFSDFHGTPEEFIEKSLQGLNKQYVVPTEEIKFLGAMVISAYSIYGVDFLRKIAKQPENAIVQYLAGIFESMNILVEKENKDEEKEIEIIDNSSNLDGGINIGESN